MSEQGQPAETGKLMRQYSDCKTELVLLQTSAERHAATLMELAELLNPPKAGPAPGNSRQVNPYRHPESLHLLLEKCPTPQEIDSILRDLHSTFRRKADLTEALREAGVRVAP